MYLLFIVHKNGLNISTTKKNEVLIFFYYYGTKQKGSAPFFIVLQYLHMKAGRASDIVHAEKKSCVISYN